MILSNEALLGVALAYGRFVYDTGYKQDFRVLEWCTAELLKRMNTSGDIKAKAEHIIKVL